MALMASGAAAYGQRSETLLEKDWRFTRDDSVEYSEPGYDDSAWQSVTVPHDWAIYGPFSEWNDRQHMAIVQDGQTDAMEHAGRTGGLPFTGTGWYRTEFEVPDLDGGRRCSLVFDGAMSHARVWINGQEACYWPYGYNSFHFDATPYVHEGMNTLAVRLENEAESSRWYPGAGLYRNVHVVFTSDAHVPVWGTQVITGEIGKGYARVSQKTGLELPEGRRMEDYRIVTEIIDGNGRAVTSSETEGTEFDGGIFRQEFIVRDPRLWTPETPALYTSQAGRRLFPERGEGRVPGSVQPPRSGTAWRHSERCRNQEADKAAERYGLQCDTDLAQHACAGAGEGV